MSKREPFHFHSTPEQWEVLKPRAREMRHEPTIAESVLWQRLRNQGIPGAKFRRQYAIASFIVDFVCLDRQIIVEVDGDVHDGQQEYDAFRQKSLEEQRFRLLRFSNEEVLRNTNAVVQRIADELVGLLPDP